MPSDLFLLPITKLQTLVASTARWQALVGCSTAGEAAKSVYKNSARGINPRPRAIVGTTGNRTLRRKSTTSWNLTAPLFMEFELETPDEFIGNHNAGHDWFLGEIETLIEQMAALAGSNGHLDVEEFTEAEPPLPFAEELNDEREYWGTVWEVAISGVLG